MYKLISRVTSAVYRYFLYYVLNTALFFIAFVCTCGQGHVDFPESRLHNAEIGVIGSASIALSFVLYIAKHRGASQRNLVKNQQNDRLVTYSVYGAIMFLVTLTWIIRCAWSQLP
jgi:hypothetical protein